MTLYYKLGDNNAPIPAPHEEWLRLWDWDDLRRVRLSYLLSPTSCIEVSTTFLGMDHSFGCGAPILFETLIRGGPIAGHVQRYRTWAAAVAGHEALVQMAESLTDVQ